MEHERVLRNLLLKLFTLRRERDRLRLWRGTGIFRGDVSTGNGGRTGPALIRQVGSFADELERRILSLNLEAEPPSFSPVLDQVAGLLEALQALQEGAGSDHLEQDLAVRLRLVTCHLAEIRRDLEALRPTSDLREG